MDGDAGERVGGGAVGVPGPEEGVGQAGVEEVGVGFGGDLGEEFGQGAGGLGREALAEPAGRVEVLEGLGAVAQAGAGEEFGAEDEQPGRVVGRDVQKKCSWWGNSQTTSPYVIRNVGLRAGRRRCRAGRG